MAEQDRRPASRGYVSRLAQCMAAGLGKILLPRFASIEARIAELEARPVLTYEGVFDERRSYSSGMFVTHAGSIWHCRAATTSARPGSSSDWVLAVKRGADGRDARGDGR